MAEETGMTNYEDMYNEFHLDEETKRQLNKFASHQFPFNEITSPVSIETVISDKNKENQRNEGVNNA
ncbi:MAG: hypothetical protein PF450_15745 [Bacteroidales bacterium]|jgi:hypothetical protein|nr:hypothetical protein [Bacteroidales bacterium]